MLWSLLISLCAYFNNNTKIKIYKFFWLFEWMLIIFFFTFFYFLIRMNSHLTVTHLFFHYLHLLHKMIEKQECIHYNLFFLFIIPYFLVILDSIFFLIWNGIGEGKVSVILFQILFILYFVNINLWEYYHLYNFLQKL